MKNQMAGHMTTKDRRRSDRVVIRMPVLVSGVDAKGETFSEKGYTLTINRDGATIALKGNLTPGLPIIILPAASKKGATAQIIGQLGGELEVHVYGIKLLEPRTNIWGIQFPPLAESAEGLALILMECSACKTREVVHMSEIETSVYEGNHSLPRSCSQCGAWTRWLQTSNELSAVQSEAQSTAGGESSVAAEGRTRNKRKHVRVQVNKMKACIRHPGFGEEIVEVKDLSRGGLSFVSSKSYIEGSKIEVAVPFSEGKSNIFVSARINRSQQPLGKGLTKYGAMYVQFQ